jgi:hypothetical protein
MPIESDRLKIGDSRARKKERDRRRDSRNSYPYLRRLGAEHHSTVSTQRTGSSNGRAGRLTAMNWDRTIKRWELNWGTSKPCKSRKFTFGLQTNIL